MKYTNFNRILRNQTVYIKTATSFNLPNSIFSQPQITETQTLNKYNFSNSKIYSKKT